MAQQQTSFLKIFLACFLALFAVIVATFLLFGLSLAGMVASSGGGSKDVKVKSNSVLHLKLNGQLVENAIPEEYDFSEILPLGDASDKVGLYQTIQAIRKAKSDDKIKGIYIQPEIFEGGWASLKEMRDALIDFKSSKKFIIAYSQFYTEKSYYIASVADKIYLSPTGLTEFNGIAYSPTFYTGMFEKLELQPKIFRVGTFKSAVEPYFRKEMSEESKMQAQQFLGDIWDTFAEEVAASRKISREEVDKVATNFVFGDGNAAVQAKLIDEAAYEDVVWDKIRELSGMEEDKEDKKIKPNFVSLKNYIKTVEPANSGKEDKIAVIFAEGQINIGKSSDGTMGSATIIEQLRKARLDKHVKAVVLRVNSPGGSALASDEMNREVILTKNEKPLVVSMGDLAASGGYYISSNADYIYAHKNTITGSIGIFGIVYNTKKLFNNKLGITFDEVETHPNADFLNPNMPEDKFQDSVMQRYVTGGYGDFLHVVKTGRKFSDSLEVDKIAQGRVWSGMDALPIRLIDGYGNLDSAIVKAASLAKLEKDNYRLETLPKPKNRFEALFNKSSDAFAQQTKAQIPLQEELAVFKKIKQTFPRNGLYALMPADFKLE